MCICVNLFHANRFVHIAIFPEKWRFVCRKFPYFFLIFSLFQKGGGKLGGRNAVLSIVEMGVDGFRRHDARMAEPTLDVFHRHPLITKQAGTAMPEIMETDVPKAIELEEL